MDEQPTQTKQSWKVWANLAALIAAVVIAMVIFDWFGLALVGLFGIFITKPEDVAVPGYNYTNNALNIVAKQITAREQNEWQDYETETRSRPTRFLETFNWNILWVPMIVMGLYMFARQQF